MSVYVDALFDTPRSKNWRYDQACHMFADTLGELHAMADAIGHKREWFQNKPGFPHYDLTAGRRAKAVSLGAVELLTRKEFIAKVDELRTKWLEKAPGKSEESAL